MAFTERVIVLIDMDCFYCQVEEKLNPALKDKPIAVVQYNAWRGGGIIAVNYPARNEGVTRHMRGNDAKKKCPSINLVQVPEVRGKADLTKYREAGKEVAAVLATFTPLLQRASVDEAYLDITSLVEEKLENSIDELNSDCLKNTFVVGAELNDFLHNVKSNKDFLKANLKLAMGGLVTEQIRAAVFEKTGYKCSAGIAHNKILAKLVCSLHKPNKQTILPQDAVSKFFETIRINKITSLGGKFGQTVSDDFQITYMSQLAQISERALIEKYDEKNGKWLFNIAKGIDNEPVTTKLISKSIACCKNFTGKAALTVSEDVEHWLHELAEEMSERLGRDLKENNRKAKQMIVNFLQEINKKDVSSSRTVPLTSYETDKIAKAAFDVVKKFCMKSDGSYLLKHLGISAGNFEDVKKVREITTFFKKGQLNKSETNLNKEHKSLTTSDVDNQTTQEPQDPADDVKNKLKDITSFFKREELNRSFDKKEKISSIPSVSEVDETSSDVYNQITQELQEDPGDLIFYDDSYRVKNDESSNEPELESSYVETTNNLVNENQKCKKNSFFTKYFVEDAPSCSKIDTSIQVEDELLIKNQSQLEPAPYEEEKSEYCDSCKKMISLEEKVSHQDYHFALQLSKEEKENNRVVKMTPTQTNVKSSSTGKKRGRPKSGKEQNNTNKSLMVFFKQEEEDKNAITEVCSECNKRVRVDDLSSHMDYHTAKKIHLEINAVPIQKPPVLVSSKKSKSKTQTTNRSVISFFKQS